MYKETLYAKLKYKKCVGYSAALLRGGIQSTVHQEETESSQELCILYKWSLSWRLKTKLTPYSED